MEMNINEIAGGVIQEKFQDAFKNVVENMLDVNTPYKAKRKITIEIGFTQNESRTLVSVDCNVTEKLAHNIPASTQMGIGKDLRTGEIFAEEYGKQIRGQMSLDDYASQQVVDGNVVDTDTGEVIDLRKAVGGI